MTKRELIDALIGLNDDDPVVIEVHDTVLYEDLYDLEVDIITMSGREHEIRLCPKKFETK